MVATLSPPKSDADYASVLAGWARLGGATQDQFWQMAERMVFLQPRQWEASRAARECDKPGGPTAVGYGGARGGGKSHWMLAQIGADDCQRQPNLKCLMLRKVGRSLREAVEDLRRSVLRGVPHDYIAHRGIINFTNGSRIHLGHFKDENEIDAYLGLEYDVIGVEEATTLSSSKIKAIRTCNRTSKLNWRPRMYLTTNPGGIGHAWFKEMFIEPHRKQQETTTRFIPATVDDNAFVNEDYTGTLDSLTGWQLRAWRYGDWDIAAGQYFTTWNHAAHVVPEVRVTTNWRVWLALDYGFTHYTVVYLMAEDGDGNIYVVDEHAQRGWLVARHVTAINAMLQRHGIERHRLWKCVAGQDVFAKKQNGGTIADDYKEHGYKLEAANDDRVNGAAEMLRRLGDVEAGMAPKLFIAAACRRLIECLPSLQHDPHRPEDVLKWDTDEDGNGGDDFYDACRYGLMAVMRPKRDAPPVTRSFQTF